MNLTSENVKFLESLHLPTEDSDRRSDMAKKLQAKGLCTRDRSGQWIMSPMGKLAVKKWNEAHGTARSAN